MDELIALAGRNWRLLLIYPGGLTALGCVLGARLLFEMPLSLRRGRSPRPGSELLIATVWLLVITLLPLPQTGWPYALDLLLCLLLLEIPHWLRIFLAPDRTSFTIVEQAAPLLNIYPLLGLSVAALGQGAGSLVVQEINRSSGLLHWAGIIGWASLLPPLLGFGPWQRTSFHGLLPALRRVAHLGLLLAAALPANDDTPIVTALIGFACLVVPLAVLNRRWRGDSDRWIGWQPWLVAAFVLLIAWTSGQTLLLRLG